MGRFAKWGAWAAVVACFAPGVAAQPRAKAVLVAPDVLLEEEVRAVLAPWGVEVVPVDAASPGPTLPEAHGAARVLARAHGAAAVVWISEHAKGYAVWIYDAQGDEVVSRELSRPPPFDGPTAAAVALSIKTLLRHSATAPFHERYGAPAAQQVAPAPTPPPPEAPAAAPQAETGHEVHGSRWWALESGLGVRTGRVRPVQPELRIAFGLGLWPGQGNFGVTLQAASGPGIKIEDPNLDGRFVDTEVGARLRARWPASGRARLCLDVGASAHITSVSGFLPPFAVQSSKPRHVAPTLDFGLRGDLLLTARFLLGLRVGGSTWLRDRHYNVAGQRVFSTEGTAAEVSLFGIAELGK